MVTGDGDGVVVVVAIEFWEGIPASPVQRLARSLHRRRDHRPLWSSNLLNTQGRNFFLAALY